jgi:adenylate kinase
LDKLLDFNKTGIGVVVALHVPEEELISRMVSRAKTSGRSDDADENVQRKRLEVYTRDTLPVAGHYDGYKKVVNIEGVGTVEEIFNKICAVIDEKMGNQS